METLVKKSKFDHSKSHFGHALGFNDAEVENCKRISFEAYSVSKGRSQFIENVLNNGLSVEEVAYICFTTGETVGTMNTKREMMNEKLKGLFGTL